MFHCTRPSNACALRTAGVAVRSTSRTDAHAISSVAPTPAARNTASDRSHRRRIACRPHSFPLVVRLFLETIMPLLAGDGEALDAGFEVFPLRADLVGLVGVDARVVVDGLGDGVEQLGKIADHR